MTIKRRLLRIHLWLGITLGAFWALQGLTGALLLFNRDIQGALLAPHGASGTLLPLDAIFARASAVAHVPVQKIEAFGAGPSLLLAYYPAAGGTERTLVIDGHSGAVLDGRDPEALLPEGSGFWPWLLRWHEAMLGGDRGQWIVGSSGILLFASIGVGLWNAWPRRWCWWDAFRFSRWRTGEHRLAGWHRMVGLVAAPALLVISACGIYLAFAPVLRPVLAQEAGYRLVYKAKPVEHLAPPRITAQRAYEAALQRFPGSELVRATTPTPKSPVYFFRLLQPGEWRRWAGTSTVAVDPADGAVINVYDALSGPTANVLTDNIYPVHTGEVGGVGTRLLVLMAGLSLPTFYVTGLMLWLRRRRR